MSHTDEFNKIMNSVNNTHKTKKMQTKVIPQAIEPRDNMTPLQESISKCRIAGNVLYLPRIDEGALSNYADVRKALLNAGASYKSNTFIFPNDAKPYIDRLMGGESVNIKKEFQFFATPAELAEKLVYWADCQNHHSILEPSAGQGAIIKAIQAVCAVRVDYCELMDVNRAVLADFTATYLCDNFLELTAVSYDRIVANPPFNKNQDIDHVKHMYKLLKSGGRIVSIMSNSWRTGSQKKQIEFRQWIEDISAEVQDVEAGAFSESGTKIATCIVIIDKP